MMSTHALHCLSCQGTDIVRHGARYLSAPRQSFKNSKKALDLQQVHNAVLTHLSPEHVERAMRRADELAQRRGLTAARDAMWSSVGKQAEPQWLWHAIDYASGTVLVYVFGGRKDAVFLQLKELLEAFGITRFCPDGWGAHQ